MEANRLVAPTEPGGLTTAVKQIVLVGMHRASADTCKRIDEDSKLEPRSSFFDLGKSKYQAWFAKFLKKAE